MGPIWKAWKEMLAASGDKQQPPADKPAQQQGPQLHIRTSLHELRSGLTPPPTEPPEGTTAQLTP